MKSLKLSVQQANWSAQLPKWRASFCRRKEFLCHLRRSGIELRPCRGEHTVTTAGRIRGQLGGSSEEGSGCGDAAARLRASGRTLQIIGDDFVETDGGAHNVRGAALSGAISD